MESAGRDISDDELRAAMRDSGLGTPATRAATIETLIRRTFVARDGKNLVATDMGIGLIERPSGQEPGLARADGDLGGAPGARGARRGDTRGVHGGHLALRERCRDRDPWRCRRRAGRLAPGWGSGPRTGGPERESRARQVDGGSDAGAATLICPRCKQGALVSGKRGWGCARWREGCAFVIWFEIAGRRITDAELTDLVSKGKTRKRKWRSSDGTEIGGRLVLDVSAAREGGAARLEASGE